MIAGAARDALDEVLDVPATAIEAFRRHGHLRVDGLLGRDELDGLVPPMVEAIDRAAGLRIGIADREPRPKPFIQVPNVWLTDPSCAAFVTARRFGRVAAALLGATGVRLYHDQAVVKKAGAPRTPWHQDQYFWPIDGDVALTMWMPLSDQPADSGGLEFVSGSHVHRYQPDCAMAPSTPGVVERFAHDHGLPVRSTGAIAAGSATFHLGWTMHAAPTNESDATRVAMTVIYVADGTAVAQPTNSFSRFDLATWLPGHRGGDVISGERHPLTWSEHR